METFYPFVRGLLAWIAAIACLWPVNVPLLGFAFRASCGPKPPDMKNNELWTRAAFGALIFAAITFGCVIVDYALAVSLGFPPGPVHLIMLVVLIPIGMWLFFVMFAVDELGQGVTILLIYLLLPIFALFVLDALINWLFGEWLWNNWLNFFNGWLKDIPREPGTATP